MSILSPTPKSSPSDTSLSRHPTRGRKTPSITDLPKQPGHSESNKARGEGSVFIKDRYMSSSPGRNEKWVNKLWGFIKWG